jgi:GNAT superfamily N-acetyltransferase
MSFKIESARRADIPRLTELLNDLFDVELDFTADTTRQVRGLELLIAEDATAGNRQIVAVARDDHDQAIGMASAQIVVSTAEGALAAWIEDVVVHHDYRRQGIGKDLLDYLVAWAKTRGATRVQLVVDQENDSADFFYQALGWQTTQLVVRRRSTG